MKVFIDFDEVLTESIKSVVDILNKKYNKNVKPNDVNKWNFEDCFPETNPDEIEEIFETDEFFNNLQWKLDMFKFLRDMSTHNEVIIVTKGNEENLKKKREFLNYYGFENVKFIGLNVNESKSLVDMKDGMFIDDNQTNLEESNATFKFLYENFPDKEWNKDWKGAKIIPRRREY